NCPMTTFPSILKELPNLVSLNFSMMRDLDIAQTDKNLDEFFRVGKSRGLIQVLYLTNNKLKILPESMKNLKKLGLLDIAYNKLTTLPALGLDVAPTQLFADCNLLTSIPNNFCKVDDLEKFSVSCNQLTEFPLLLSNKKNAGKYSIEEVDLSVNKIAGFEAGFEGIRVEKLNLNSNKFGTASKSGAFPTEFSTTKSEINFLRLCYNGIKELKAEAIKNLKVLQALELAGNQLSEMPKEFNSEYLPYFSGIDLSQNDFTLFPEWILYVNSLNQVLFSGQGHFTDAAQKKFKRTFISWPSNIEKHFALKVLDVSGNDLRIINKFPDNLNKLVIADNPNIRITVPMSVIARINEGTFLLSCDKTQDVGNVND
ncbi:MAG: hypothetical protein RR319_07595, partial [Bacteroides sp.]